MKRYIIFDFDGTLVNTNDIIIASWQETFKRFLGHTMPVRTIEATFGEILVDSIARLMPGVPVNEAVDHYRAYQDSHHDDYPIYVFEGIRELLTELRKRGCIIGVGTSRTAYSFWNYMRELNMEDLIDEVVTMNDVTRHKPHPETVNAALIKMMAHDREAWETAEAQTCGCSEDDLHIPDEVRRAAVMIGDAKFDIGCAQNAGIDSVLVGWSHYVDEEDMAALGFEPTYRIERPGQLLELI